MGFSGCASMGPKDESTPLDSEIAIFNDLDKDISVGINAVLNDERILHRTIELKSGKGNESTSLNSIPSQVSIVPHQLPKRTIDVDVRDSCERADIDIWIRQNGIEHDISCLS